MQEAINQIQADLNIRLQDLDEQNNLLEYRHLEQLTCFYLEMMATTGVCSGIETYSRDFTGRAPGQPPPTLFEYLPKNAMLTVDESRASQFRRQLCRELWSALRNTVGDFAGMFLELRNCVCVPFPCNLVRQSLSGNGPATSAAC